MEPSSESWNTAVHSLPDTVWCTRRLGAAVREWSARLSSGEDWRTLQTEILSFADGDRRVLLALLAVAQRHEQVVAHRGDVVAVRHPGRSRTAAARRSRHRGGRSTPLRHRRG